MTYHQEYDMIQCICTCILDNPTTKDSLFVFNAAPGCGVRRFCRINVASLRVISVDGVSVPTNNNYIVECGETRKYLQIET